MKDRNGKRENRPRSGVLAVLIASTMAVAGIGGFALASLGHSTGQGAQVTAPHGQPQAHDSGAATLNVGSGHEQSGTDAGQPAGNGPANNPGNPGGPKGQGPNSPSAVCCVNLQPQGLPNPPFPKPTPKSPGSIRLPFP